ncbi:MAG: translocation/assembly module TamB domain-containing protein [Nitrospirota bacterium]
MNEEIEKRPLKRTKKIITVILLVAAVVLLIIIAKGPYASSAIEKLVIRELEAASGAKITVSRVYLNIFPLFVGAEGLKSVDETGNEILSAQKIKGYIGLAELFSRQISVRRLVIFSPVFFADSEQLGEIVKNVQAYLRKETRPLLKTKIKVVEVVKGNVALRDDDLQTRVWTKNFTGELITGRTQRIKFSARELEIEKKGWPKLICDVDTLLTSKKEMIEINRLKIGFLGSLIRGEGFYSRDTGSFKTEITLIVDSIKQMFGLGQRGEGIISAKGELRLEENREEISAPGAERRAFSLRNIDPVTDLKIKGDFYLETLMELLKVKEKLSGHVDFSGNLGGRLRDIRGTAKAQLRNGNLFDVEIDRLACDVSYNKKGLEFRKGFAHLYNGTAQAEASLSLPVVESYRLFTNFQSIESEAILKLLGWEPPIPSGKVDGELATSGSRFEPGGWFVYKSVTAEKKEDSRKLRSADFIGSIRDIEGKYFVKDNVLSLSDIRISTLLSHLSAGGDVHLVDHSLDIKANLYTDDISDLTLPYYSRMKGRGIFEGFIKGKFDNPTVSGMAEVSQVSLEGYDIDKIKGNFRYEQNLLRIDKSFLRSHDEEHFIFGKIHFPKAKKLFDMSDPLYDLKASVRNASLKQLITSFTRDVPARGRLNADIEIKGTGDNPDVYGKVTLEKASLAMIPFDFASAGMHYTNSELHLGNIKVRRGKSMLSGEGIMSRDRFSYALSSERLYIKDFGISGMPDDALAELRSDGHGTFDNPVITLNAKILGGTFKGRDMGIGTIVASVRNKDVSVSAALFNEKMTIRGRAFLSDKLPWSAEANIEPGRYDFIVSSFLKEVPEDLHLTFQGNIKLMGDRKNLSAAAHLDQMTLSIFEQTFSSDSAINISLKNERLFIQTFTLRSGTASVRLQGGMQIGKEYDLVIDGSSSLAPLKGLSKEIGHLKGDSTFVFSVTGRWENPEINGGMNVSNASLGLKGYPTYISSIEGYFYVDKDRIIVDRLSGKIGGGSVNISGLVDLKALSPEKFYIEAELDDIATSVSKDVDMNLSGELVFRGTEEVQSIAGDIKINKARYKKMVEWRSWLLTGKPKDKLRSEMSIFERASLNIRISGSENIIIDNNLARAPVSIRGDMVVKGSVSNPVLLGRLEATEGYVYFRNNEFRIIYASADFTDPNRIKPLLNLSAETTIKGYDIRLNLEGRLDHFILSLSSDPHLEEVDILALLTVGQIGKQLKGLEGGIGAGEATSFLTGKVQDVIEERLRTITGLDRFQVEPYVSKTTGAVEPRITVSERLVGDKLFVTYATSVGSVEEQVLKIEYLLDKNISLIGVRDEIGSLGGDLKFRFEFK